MGMKLVKATDDYSIYERGDKRYAVKDASKKPVNGDDKVRILVEEGLIKAALPAEPVAEETEAEVEAAEEGAADDAGADEAPAEDDAPAEDAAEDEDK